MKKVIIRDKDGKEEEINLPDEWYAMYRLIENSFDELRKCNTV